MGLRIPARWGGRACAIADGENPKVCKLQTLIFAHPHFIAGSCGLIRALTGACLSQPDARGPQPEPDGPAPEL